MSSGTPSIEGVHVLHLGVGILSALGGACTLGDLDVGGLPCPCAPQFRCDDEQGICIEDDSLAPDLGSSSRDLGTSTDLGGSLSDAGAADPDPPESICDTSEAAAWVFCDGFEAAGLARWTDRKRKTGTGGETSVERQTDTVYRGKGALRARVSGTGDSAGLYVNVFPDPADSIWVRGYYRFPGPVGDIGFMGFGNRTHEEKLVLASGEDEIDVHIQRVGADYRDRQISKVILPQDRWFCALLHLDVTRGETTIIIDGVKLAVERFDNSVVDGHTRFDVGFIAYRYGEPRSAAGRDEGREVLVDEVIVSTSSIACDGR
ncbi:MAG: hypothetical protein AAFU79_00665 [Myxococcota bacterium]